MSGGTAAVAGHTGGTGQAGPPIPVRLASVYLPAPLPREGRIAFWDPDGGTVTARTGTESGTSELTVVRRHGTGVRRRRVPALTLPL
ncbi:hypothetical protein, partial [Streptomyces roseochromogenus]|uniref:hypothetical protein n=1 Tax=Streptomyces roseochromogenus TaxID=285450 RepID=UPI00056900A0